MAPRSLSRTLLLLALGVGLVAGCQAPRKGGGSITAAAAPVAAPKAAAPTSAPAADGSAVVGLAALPDGPFEGATIKAFKPGSATAIATGQIGADGKFGLALGKAVPQGAALKLVATRGEKTLATMVAAGAGNLVAAGGGNLVAAGGGNLVAAGGGNMVAAGAGNLVAAGAGNFAPRFALLASEPGNATLNLGTTVAVAALGKRLDGAAAAGLGADGKLLGDVLDAVFSAFGKFTDEANEALAKDPTLADRVLDSLDETGTGGLDAGLADSLAESNAALKEAFADAAEALGDALTAAAEQGVDVTLGTEALSFAGELIEAVTLPDDPVTPPGGQPGPSPEPEPAPGEPLPGGGSSGGSSGGGSSGGDGSGGAEGNDTESDGSVTIRGSFTPPSPIVP